jgi:alanine racemase
VLGPSTGLGVVVKADGYGHGLVAAAHAALTGGAALLAVATLDEALALREAGFRARILVLYAVPPYALEEGLAADLDLTAMDRASIEQLALFVRRIPSAAGRLRVHLGIDSGMTRGGVLPDEAVAAARRLLASGLPKLAGTWSHLASPEDRAATDRQLEAFEGALRQLRTAGIDPGLRHLNATSGLLDDANPAWDLARLGLAFYGHLPGDARVGATRAAIASLRPVLTLRARATSVETVPAGTSVGYGGSWTAARTSRIATLGLGYADRWTRLYAPGSSALVRDLTVPLVGRVGSDAVAVDVTDVPGFDGSDEVVVLAPDGAGSSVDDLARRRGSIAWEVLDDFTPRLARVYTEGGRPVAARCLDGRFVKSPGFELCLAAEAPRRSGKPA